jgi:hypothetical protein
VIQEKANRITVVDRGGPLGTNPKHASAADGCNSLRATNVQCSRSSRTLT